MNKFKTSLLSLALLGCSSLSIAQTPTSAPKPTPEVQTFEKSLPFQRNDPFLQPIDYKNGVVIQGCDLIIGKKLSPIGDAMQIEFDYKNQTLDLLLADDRSTKSFKFATGDLYEFSKEFTFRRLACK